MNTQTNGLVYMRRYAPKTQNGIEIDEFNCYLSNLWDLISISKEHHWKTNGLIFIPLHQLYAEIYEWSSSSIDAIAENIIGNDFEFSIKTNSIECLKSASSGEGWREMLEKELGNITSATDNLTKAIIRAEDAKLYGLVGILQRQLEEIEIFIYKIKQILS